MAGETYENLMVTKSPSLADYTRIVSADGKSKRSLLSALAALIVEEYAGTSLAGQARSLQSAINELDEATSGETSARQEADTAIENRIAVIETAIYIGSDGKCYVNLEED